MLYRDKVVAALQQKRAQFQNYSAARQQQRVMLDEWLVQFCKETLMKTHYDCFVFGHRHLPIDFHFKNQNSRYINLGDWVRYNTYAVIDAHGIELKSWEKDSKIFTNEI